MARIFKSKLAWAAALVAALVGLYALVGVKVAPGLVRDQAIKYVSQTYGRELRIGEVRIDPFKLQAEIRDLAFPDADPVGVRVLRTHQWIEHDGNRREVMALPAAVLARTAEVGA